MTVLAYPDANPETTTVDGRVEGVNAVWATARALSNGNPNDSSLFDLLED